MVLFAHGLAYICVVVWNLLSYIATTRGLETWTWEARPRDCRLCVDRYRCMLGIMHKYVYMLYGRLNGNVYRSFRAHPTDAYVVQLERLI